MNIRQLRALVAVCENKFSISKAAKKLHLVQSAVSRQIQLLEHEIGTPLFVRHGKRFINATPICQEVSAQAREALLNLDNIRQLGVEYATDSTRGELRIGTTHMQARYVLPQVVQSFRRVYPNVFLQLHQGTPQQLVDMLAANAVDIAICTEELEKDRGLEVMTAYHWNRAAIVKPGHSLARKRQVSLADLTQYPLITYVEGFTGRRAFDDAFRIAGLSPSVIVSAADSDVIKTYVALGLGVGIVANMSFEPRHDSHLVAKDLSSLFPQMTTKLAYRRGKFLTSGARRFIEIFLETMTAKNAKVR